MGTATESPDQRRRELAQIHIARKDLALDEETYRDVLWSCARVTSAGHLDSAGRKLVIEHLKARGWTPRRGSRVERSFGRKPYVAADRQPLLDKIEALLADAARPWSYAESMARRICKVDSLRFCTSEQLGKIVAALSYDAKRRRS